MINKIHKTLFIALIFLTISLFYNGYEYYLLPIKERVFHFQHTLLKPSGIIGHGLGIIGTLLILIGVFSYIMRKRIKLLSRVGAIKNWLEFHITLCSIGPILIVYHTAFKFGGIVAFSFWSMVIVVISGVVGRFIYIQIPRTQKGDEMSFDELKKINQSITDKLINDYNVSDELINQLNYFSSLKIYKQYGPFQVIKIIFQDYKKSRKEINQLKLLLKNENIDEIKSKKIIEICKEKLVLSRKISIYDSVKELFRYWHIFHLPFAILMLLIVIIHVIVAISFGYRWIF
jgi:hypothetical protein